MARAKALHAQTLLLDNPYRPQSDPDVEQHRETVDNEAPRQRKKRLEQALLELDIQEAIAMEKLKEIRQKRKEKLELIVACMNEMSMPLLEIMMSENGNGMS